MKKPAPQRHAAAFTLVELAIVLVIIGLLTGAILTGQELIAQARLRRLVNILTAYDTAAVTFRLKYNALAGDVLNPGNLGLPCTGSRTGANTESDGDGVIESHYSWISPGYPVFTNEVLWFWDDLQTVGLITSSINPTLCTSPNSIPNSGMGKYLPDIEVSVKNNIMVYPDGRGKHWFSVATFFTNPDVYNAGDGLMNNMGITPWEASSVDSKLDDGKPYTGKVQDGYGIYSVNLPYHCVVSATAYDTSPTYGSQSLCALRVGTSF